MIWSRIRVASRLVVAMATIATLIVMAEPARAVTVPETLADRRPVSSAPVQPAFAIDYLGVLWDEVGDEANHAHSDEVGANGFVRFRVDGVWGGWIALSPDGAKAEGHWASGLVAASDAEAYQVRGLPAEAASPRAVAINTTDGARVKVGEIRGGAAGALDSTSCRSRKDWGADERLRFDGSGNELWPPTFYPLQTATVHHTATKNDDPDPAATVRAIYRYHAVDNGWGDIGYQFLVDEQGIVYEGRWSGTESRSCTSSVDGTYGDGSDFGHETGDADADGSLDEMVTGAHVGGSNSGNIGVALLGDFTDNKRFGADPKPAAVDSLEDVLAELALRHGLDPTGTVDYVNPVTGDSKHVDAISGHRDWSATECPGDRLYAQLPIIRTNVKTAVDAGGDDSTTTRLSVGSVAPDTVSPGTAQVAVLGSGFAAGATVAFEDGKGKSPAVTATTVTSDTRIDVTLLVEAKGPSGAWDVRVTLPDGRSAVCARCLAVRR